MPRSGSTGSRPIIEREIIKAMLDLTSAKSTHSSPRTASMQFQAPGKVKRFFILTTDFASP